MRLAIAIVLCFAAPWYGEYVRNQDEAYRGLAIVGYILLVGYFAATWIRKNS